MLTHFWVNNSFLHFFCYNESMNGFGKKLRELREERGLSQMELSEKVDITQSSLARYELEKTEPKLSDIKKLCAFFKVSADYVLGLTDAL